MNISINSCPPQNDNSLSYSYHICPPYFFNQDQGVAVSVHQNENNLHNQNLKGKCQHPTKVYTNFPPEFSKLSRAKVLVFSVRHL